MYKTHDSTRARARARARAAQFGIPHNGPSTFVKPQVVSFPTYPRQNLDFQNMKRETETPKPLRSIRVGPAAEPELMGRGIRWLRDVHGPKRLLSTFPTQLWPTAIVRV
jgi:hypothetical protein